MSSNRITSAEIEAICIKHSGINNILVKKYEIEAASKQPKFTSSKNECEILKVTVKNPFSHDDVEYRFFMKILTKIGATDNEFDSELVVYESLIPLIRNNHPIEWISACYLTKRSDTVDLMILEDFSKRGKLVQTPDVTLDHIHLRTAIRYIANMHATSIILAKRQPVLMKCLLNNKFEKNVAEQAKLMDIGIDLLGKLAKEIPKFSDVAENLHKKISDKIRSTIEFFQPSKDFSNVFSHGNLRPDNIIFRYGHCSPDDSRYSQFFYLSTFHIFHYIYIQIVYGNDVQKGKCSAEIALKYTGENVEYVDQEELKKRKEWIPINMFVREPTPIAAVFINFGMAYWTPPAMDVLSFLYLASTKENRSEMLRQYHHDLNYHLEVYCREVEIVFGMIEWIGSCEHYRLGALIKTSIVVHNTLAESLDVSNVEELERLCFDALKTNPNYSERISGLLDEIMEIISL